MKKRKIVLILKDSLNRQPPTMSVCGLLLDLGVELTIISVSIKEETKQEFEKRGAKVFTTGMPRRIPGLGMLNKILHWRHFKNKVRKILSSLEFDYIWLGSADATIALGELLEGRKYVMQVLELYDQKPFYKKAMRKYMENACCVVVPEEVRAHIFRAWYQLKKTPFVLPNKPYFHPRKRNLPITDPAAAAAFAKIPAGSKIIFYQGGMSDRRDLKPVARAVERAGAPWALAIQCPIVDNDYYKDLFANYKFYHIPYVQAPLHLEITSNVHFGLVAYTHISMNNEFCAPNKIWEYSGFGLPMIGNDVFGLKNTIGRYEAGVLLNFDRLSEDEIIAELKKLQAREEEYSRNATRFFESWSNEDVVRQILDTLEETADEKCEKRS